jgi:hypothetical protein
MLGQAGGGHGAIRAATDEINRRHHELKLAHQARPYDAEAHHRAAQRLLDAVLPFYASFRAVRAGLRTADPEAIEAAFVFLELDPWCFGSGYLRADLMHAVANLPDLRGYEKRAQAIVLGGLTRPRPRLLRHNARLAAAVWNEELGHAVHDLAAGGDARTTGECEVLLGLVENQLRTEHRPLDEIAAVRALRTSPHDRGTDAVVPNVAAPAKGMDAGVTDRIEGKESQQ